MIEKVTFTGVDVSASPFWLEDMACMFPWLEWGVLVGSQTGGANPIFPPLERVEMLKNRPLLNPEQIAIHLCGKYARQAAGVEEPTEELYELCNGFGRVQVNLHPDSDGGRFKVVNEALIAFAERPEVERVILQHRSGWEDVPIEHENIEYLFDRSEGSGTADFEAWPAPPDSGRRAGYAGGIGPDTILQALAFHDDHASARMWFDMEGRIRTGSFLDPYKVKEVCQSVRTIMLYDELREGRWLI